MVDVDDSGFIDREEMTQFVAQLKAMQTEGNFK